MWNATARLAYKLRFISAGPEYWKSTGEAELREALTNAARINTNTAQNVVLFVGDGMGLSTVTASRIFRGQQNEQPGEEHKLAFEKFPNIALAKVIQINTFLDFLFYF